MFYNIWHPIQWIPEVLSLKSTAGGARSQTVTSTPRNQQPAAHQSYVSDSEFKKKI